MTTLSLRALLLGTAVLGLLAAPAPAHALAHEGERHRPGAMGDTSGDQDAPARTERGGLGAGATTLSSDGGPSAIGDTSGDQDDPAAPVHIEGLGDDGLILEGASPEVQAWFDQGLGHLRGFIHAEAVRALREAQALDTDCALCLWGEAHALGPNLTDAMHPEAEARAGEAAQAAAALARTPATRR